MHAFDKDHIILDYFSHEAPVLGLELDRDAVKKYTGGIELF